jgi:hypothetical protein
MPLIAMKLLAQGGENRILHSTDIRRMVNADDVEALHNRNGLRG